MNPENVDINKRKIKNWFFEVNTKQVLDDIKACEEWYKKYTTSGVSPQWNDAIDSDIVNYLDCKNYNEWEKLYLEWVEMGKAVPEYEEETSVFI